MRETLLGVVGEGRDPRARHGVVLVVVLSILAILAMMMTVFITFQTMEKKVAANFVDDVRARMLAQSGLESSTDFLTVALMGPAGPAAGSRTMTYWGADNNEEDAGGLVGGGTVNDPIERAVNPSFALEADADPDNPGGAVAAARTMLVAGQTRGVSGVMATGAYGLNSDVYTLRVTDTSGTLYVNDGLGHDYRTAVLQRILNRTGEELPAPIVDLGNRIIANRPSGGYASKEQIKQFFTQAEYDQFVSLVTTAAWQDPDVANPVPLSLDAKEAYRVPTATDAGANPKAFTARPTSGGLPVARYGRGRRAKDGVLNPGLMMFQGTGAGNSTVLRDTSIYGHDELNARYIEIGSRAPVNLNSASREVLVGLLRDLEGFFLVEQARPINDVPGNGHGQSHYNWLMHHAFLYYDFSASDLYYPTAGSGREHTAGEIGVLFRTTPVTQTMARMVADEIIACRGKVACTPHGGTHNYASLAWGGRFTGWQQFNMFVDALVDDGSLADPRLATDYYVYPAVAAYGAEPGSGNTAYPRYASEAIADAIKANANPNLHLNELNPNLPINGLVDKTDLIQPSTEFCFNPTGTFEVESLGRVLKPRGGIDSFLAADNLVAAEKKVTASLRLFAQKRFGTQKHFYEGTLSAAANDGETYGNTGLAIGPELDQGLAPSENEYEGYLSLSTHGSSLPAATQKAKNTVVATATYDVASTITSAETTAETLMHAHFDLDYRLHGAKGRAEPLTVAPAPPNRADGKVAIEPPPTSWNRFWNFPDRTEPTVSVFNGGAYEPPYGPSYNAVYRLATSYRWTGAAPAVTPRAPSDLRHDGAYSERGSAPLYIPDDDNEVSDLNLAPTDPAYDNNFDPRHGTVAYWVKPGYEPQFMGKHRALFNVDRGGRGCWWTSAANNLAQYVMTGQQDDAWSVRHLYSNTTDRNDASPWKYKFLLRGSTGFGFQTCAQHANGSIGYILDFMATPSLNHTYTDASYGAFTHTHPPVPMARQAMMRHHWTHFAVSWDLNWPAAEANPYPRLFYPIQANQTTAWPPLIQTYVNGREIDFPDGYNRIPPEIPGYSPIEQLADTNLNPYWVRYTASAFVKGMNVYSNPYMLDTILHRKIIEPTSTLKDATGMPYATMVPVALGSIMHADDGGTLHDDWAATVATRWVRNFPADATIDEFYLWHKSIQDASTNSDALDHWGNGRYYRGTGADAGMFTSAAMNPASWQAAAARLLPTASGAAAPSPGTAGTALVPPGGGGGGDLRILGMTWTVYGDPPDPSDPNLLVSELWSFRHAVHNFAPVKTDGMPVVLNPRVGARVSTNGGTTWTPAAASLPMTDPKWSSVQQSVAAGSTIKYRIEFDWDAPGLDTLNAVLLTTPILDDVTIFYQDVSFLGCYFSP